MKERKVTMPPKDSKAKTALVKELLSSGKDFLRPLVQEVVQQVLEAETYETVGAEKGERASQRVGYRSGYYSRTLVTRVGLEGEVLDKDPVQILDKDELHFCSLTETDGARDIADWNPCPVTL